MNTIISIIIATFNGERTLPLVLNSIRRQDFTQGKIEILIIDGGSTDKTLKIAKEFDCKILKNPEIEPISAKRLGFYRAKGKYLLYIDQDEVIYNTKSLSIKYALFQKNPYVKAIIGSGYRDPQNTSFITSYINEFGDPFSFLMYKISKNSNYFINELRQNFRVIKEDERSIIFDFSSTQKVLLFELGAANTMIDLTYIRKEFPDFNIDVFSHLFQFLKQRGALVAITKNDPIIHHSSSTFRNYINKIQWRVKNNIYYSSGIGISGFSGREKFQPLSFRFKKYVFILYALSLIFPILDALHLMFSRKKISYILHVPLSFFTATFIIYHYILKIFGVKPLQKNYDQSRVIRNNNNEVQGT